jgi:hypothetical protein
LRDRIKALRQKETVLQSAPGTDNPAEKAG